MKYIGFYILCLLLSSIAVAQTEPDTARINEYLSELKASTGIGAKQLPDSASVDINTASASILEQLPGVGRKKAAAIIQARPYNTRYDLLRVKGIGKKRLLALWPYLKPISPNN